MSLSLVKSQSYAIHYKLKEYLLTGIRTRMNITSSKSSDICDQKTVASRMLRNITNAENIAFEHEYMQLKVCLPRWKEERDWRKDLG
jgi:hypothetical protein